MVTREGDTRKHLGTSENYVLDLANSWRTPDFGIGYVCFHATVFLGLECVGDRLGVFVEYIELVIGVV